MLIISIITFIITCIALLCFFQREHKRAMFSIFSKNIKNASKAFYDYVDELFIEKGRDFFDNVLIEGGVERYVSDFDQYFKKMCQEKFVTFKSFSDYDEAYDKAYKEEREKAKNECSFYKELSTEGIKTHFLLYIINYFVHLISFELDSEVYDSIYESKLGEKIINWIEFIEDKEDNYNWSTKYDLANAILYPKDDNILNLWNKLPKYIKKNGVI